MTQSRHWANMPSMAVSLCCPFSANLVLHFHAVFVSTGKSTVNVFLNNVYDLVSLEYEIHSEFSLKDFQYWIFNYFSILVKEIIK